MKQEHYDFITENLGIPKATMEETINSKHSVLGDILGALVSMLGVKDKSQNAADVIQTICTDCTSTVFDGGPGSGNFNHKGRPGEVGGSAEGEGSEESNKSETSKKNAKLAKPHEITYEELKEIPDKSVVIVDSESTWEKGDWGDGFHFLCTQTGEIYRDWDFYTYVKQASPPEGAKIAIPKSAKGSSDKKTSDKPKKENQKLSEDLTKYHTITTKELEEVPDGTVIKFWDEDVGLVKKTLDDGSVIYYDKEIPEFISTPEEIYDEASLKNWNGKFSQSESNKEHENPKKLEPSPYLEEIHNITPKELNDVPDGTLFLVEGDKPDEGLEKKTLDDGTVVYIDKDYPDFQMKSEEVYHNLAYVNLKGKFLFPEKHGFKKEWIKHHTPEKGELKEYPEGSDVYFEGDIYKKQKDGSFINDFDKSKFSREEFEKKILDSGSKIAVIPPSEENESENLTESMTSTKEKNSKKTPKTSFTSEAYTEERKKNAFSTGDIQAVHDTFNDLAKNAWDFSSYEIRAALKEYTGSGFVSINAQLRAGKFDEDRAEIYNGITDTISECKIPVDTYYQRGIRKSTFSKFLGVDFEEIEELFKSGDASSLVGRPCKDKAFMSVGSSLGYGFTDKPVQLEIFAPKGTEAMYIEPISEFGHNGNSYDYDKPSGNSEFETLLQRNTSFVISDAVFKFGQLFVQCEIVSQKYDRL